MHRNTYVAGDFLAVCDVCGQTWYGSQMRRGVTGTQKGLVVCPPDFDEPHPNETRPPFRRESEPTRVT